MNEYHIDYGKYYDKHSIWLFSPSIRKQNKNLELKTQVEIGKIEKEQKIWLKGHEFERLQRKRELQKFQQKLDKRLVKSSSFNEGIHCHCSPSLVSSGSRRCFSVQNDYSEFSHSPSTDQRKRDGTGDNLRLPDIRPSTTETRHRRHHSTPVLARTLLSSRTDCSVTDLSDVFECEKSPVSSPSIKTTQQRRLLKHRGKTVSLESDWSSGNGWIRY